MPELALDDRRLLVELQSLGVRVVDETAGTMPGRRGGAGPSDAMFLWVRGLPLTVPSHAAFVDAPHVPTPHPMVRLLCTTEHTMIGLGSALIGGNVAQFRIWDGMRVIDYLQSRPDILADKIGCCGNSGGGTETAYLMALDERIAAAAPGCYLTTFRRLIEENSDRVIAAEYGAAEPEPFAVYIPVRDYCHMRLSRLASEAPAGA